MQDDDYGIRLQAAELVGDFLGLRKKGVDQEVALSGWWEYLAREGAEDGNGEEFGRAMEAILGGGLEEGQFRFLFPFPRSPCWGLLT